MSPMRSLHRLAVAALISSAVLSTSRTTNAQEKPATEPAQCPVMGDLAGPNRTTRAGAMSNDQWWPNQLNVDILHQNSTKSNPMGPNFNYAEEFSKLDIAAVKKDIKELMHTSQDWWPADYGHYGPLFIRMAWHSAGTYRVEDGRGGAGYGTQRFAPLNSWPDNASLDKARRLIWPIKQKYGNKISWADLMVLTGNCALEDMGVKTFGFAGGREDVWEPQKDIFWGPESVWLGDQRYKGDRELEKPLAAVQMGLIYVNPEGPNANHKPETAVKDIRETFTRMAMTDEETVALIAGGHTFGKAHGAVAPSEIGPEPEAAPLEEQGFGWKNKVGKGNAELAMTSGLEGAWSSTPTQFSTEYLDNLFNFEWEKKKTPAGATVWVPVNNGAAGTVPDAHIKGKTHQPIMFTTDLALLQDPEYKKIAKRFQENPKEFELAFAKAWYKLTTRDMGPAARLLGNEVPEPQLWQDPVPKVDFVLVDEQDIAALKTKILATDLTVSQLVSTAWASASTFRGGDKRGGANGARIRLAPQKDWAVNEPAELQKVLAKLEKIQKNFNAAQKNGKKISLADVIVLAGSAGIEKAAKNAGHDVKVPFYPGRTDATQEMTDVASVAYLEPKADGFRNYYSHGLDRPAEELLLDRAQKLTLTAPEMTVLVGGMRVLDTNVGIPGMGVFTDRKEALTNDFFVNLLDMSTEWKKSAVCDHFFEGRDRKTGKMKYTATSVDLVFGSNSQLRATAEVYATSDSEEKFVNDFIAAWTKVMNLDRYDLIKAPKKAIPAVAASQN